MEIKGIDDALHADVEIQSLNGAEMEKKIENISEVAGIEKDPKEIDPNFSTQKWPEPLSDKAMIGFAGDFIRTMEGHTESDSVALLLQFLLAFGSVVGRRAHFKVEAADHFLNLNVVLVGRSSRGRKGTSWKHIERLFEAVDPEWKKNCVKSGLSSGEGLMSCVRDPLEKIVRNEQTGQDEVVIQEPGVSDKRLCVVEGEFAGVLRVLQREGNKLSAVIRDAWDHGKLSSLVRNNPIQVEKAHISICGHITFYELTRYISETELTNGFANRFLWSCVKREKLIPLPKRLDLSPWVPRLREIVEFGTHCEELLFDEEAKEKWCRFYHAVAAHEPPGLVGAVTSRAEAQVIRLASLYAVLDRSSVIRKIHLQAAVAVWTYCEASCKYIFGEKTGNQFADKIMTELRVRPDGIKLTALHREVFKSNVSASKIHEALQILEKSGWIERIQGDRDPIWQIPKSKPDSLTSGNTLNTYYVQGEK